MEEVQLCSPGSLETTTSRPRGRMVCNEDCSVLVGQWCGSNFCAIGVIVVLYLVGYALILLWRLN